MKKNLLCLCFTVSMFVTSFAQTAPDFTATDCNGNSHNLYSELAQGKVIVLAWVMPCGACTGPALTAYNVAQSFANPNVLYYLIDDAGNTACSSLSSWATGAGIGTNRSTFSTASIVESSYGGIGMPHIAVVGQNGFMYFNALNSAAGNSTAIQNAINDALNATGIAENSANTFSLSVFPSPASDKTILNYSLKEATSVSLNVLNELGQNVGTYSLDKQSAGKHEYQFDVKALANGNYFVRFNTEQKTQLAKFVVSH
ncbi:MAG: T9SS type A sorting domain-containing protein [Bacteroidota bacterium]